jgi:hypothetical protein
MTADEIPVCSLCLCPLAVGMVVVLFHPDHWRAFLAATHRRASPIDENPVAVCRPCWAVIKSTVPTIRPQ